MELAQEFLEELLQVLTDDENEDKSPEEVMGEVMSIVDDYKSELDLLRTEKEERDNLTMMGISDESESEQDEEDTTTFNPVNRAFLLTKAQKEYYKKLGLTEEDLDDFTPAEKVKHRKGITELFNKMVKAEQTKTDRPSEYANGPFKKIPGNISVTRRPSNKDDIEEDDDNEEETPAQTKWKAQQSKELKTNIKSLTVEIDELKRQNKIPKISPSIINRNNERVAELEEQLEELDVQRNQYK